MRCQVHQIWHVSGEYNFRMASSSWWISCESPMVITTIINCNSSLPTIVGNTTKKNHLKSQACSLGRTAWTVVVFAGNSKQWLFFIICGASAIYMHCHMENRELRQFVRKSKGYPNHHLSIWPRFCCFLCSCINWKNSISSETLSGSFWMGLTPYQTLLYTQGPSIETCCISETYAASWWTGNQTDHRGCQYMDSFWYWLEDY